MTKPFKALVLLALTVTSIAQAEEPVNQQKKPNIIFLLADDQNTLSVGCYGNKEVQTPNMDKLGADGVIFDKHYNTTAICMASRANVMTGMYEYKTGTNFEHGDMTQEIWEKSYPMLLREAGYLTGFAGKFGFEIEGLGFNGESFFDKWGGGPVQTEYETAKNLSMKKYAQQYPHSTLSYGAFGQDFIRESVKEQKPFCLSISFKAPHRPVEPDPKFDHIYKGKTFTKPANYGRENGEHLAPQSKTGRQYPRFEEWGYDTNYDEAMAKYYQQVYAIDVSLGMIREELEAQGVADNTVIIYTSDNGFICGSHGYGSKVLPLEESSRAPLMIYDPRNPSVGSGTRSAALTGNIDFAPTILDLAGIEIPENIDGTSLLPLLEKPESDIRESLAFINTFGDTPTQSLTMLTKEWKYTYWWYGDEKLAPVEELFHVKADPGEMKNLAEAESSAKVLKNMRALYDQQLKHWGAEGISTNGYAQYTTLFSRHIPWGEKKIDRHVHGTGLLHWSEKNRSKTK